MRNARVFAAAAAAAILVVALLATTPVAAQLPARTFKAGTELVAIEATVLDEAGDPVAHLTAADFVVSVAGQRRAIQSVQFIRTEPANRPPSPREAGVSTNQLPSSGRLLLIVVDESNLRPGGAVAVARAADGLLSRLSPGDLVGLARIPDGGGVEFTTDRGRLVEGLQQITGRPPRPRTSRVNVSLSEAADYEDGQRLQWPAALGRECGEPSTFGYQECVGAMQLEAIGILREEELKRAHLTGALSNLIRAAGAASAPATMVLISESLFPGRDPGALSGLATAAATARVSLHVVRPSANPFGVGRAGYSSDPARDNELMRQGLETLAAQFNGGFHEVSSTGAGTFDRISRELSGYYLLGVEPTDDDRKARTRQLRVAITRPGVTVRARSMFSVPDGTERGAPDANRQLQQMLKAAASIGGLPMKLTALTVGNGADTSVRLLVSAEIGDDIDRETTYYVGLLALGATGEAMTSTAGSLRLSPARAGVPSPALFTTSLVLQPGDYSLRLAAIGPDGRAGSVHHPARAGLRHAAGGFTTSDLIVSAAPPPRQFPRFNASAIVTGPDVAAIVEVTHEDHAELDALAVRFEVAGHALKPLGSAAQPSHGGGSRRTFSLVTPLDLPRGEYVVTAVLTPRAGEPFRVMRPFFYEPGPPR